MTMEQVHEINWLPCSHLSDRFMLSMRLIIAVFIVLYLLTIASMDDESILMGTDARGHRSYLSILS